MNQLTAHSPYRVLGVAVNEVTPVQGRLGTHTVQALPVARAGLPSLRQIGHSIGAGFRRLADRVVALVSPERSRFAQAQVRAGLQATDAAVTSLVSAIKRAGASAATDGRVREKLAAVLQQAERTCRRAAHPLEARDALVCARLAIVMGQQDLRQPPSMIPQCGQHGGRLGRVNQRGVAACGVVQQVDVVMLQAGQGDQRQRHLQILGSGGAGG